MRPWSASPSGEAAPDLHPRPPRFPDSPPGANRSLRDPSSPINRHVRREEEVCQVRPALAAGYFDVSGILETSKFRASAKSETTGTSGIDKIISAISSPPGTITFAIHEHVVFPGTITCFLLPKLQDATYFGFARRFHVSRNLEASETTEPKLLARYSNAAGRS
jgi:hypothetical protein